MDAYTHLNYEANVRVRWNRHTNALEGSKVSHRDTAQIVLKKESVAGYPLQVVNEVAGHDRALRHMEEQARSGNILQARDWQAWQEMLLGPESEPLQDELGNFHVNAVLAALAWTRLELRHAAQRALDRFSMANVKLRNFLELVLARLLEAVGPDRTLRKCPEVLQALLDLGQIEPQPT